MDLDNLNFYHLLYQRKTQPKWDVSFVHIRSLVRSQGKRCFRDVPYFKLLRSFQNLAKGPQILLLPSSLKCFVSIYANNPRCRRKPFYMCDTTLVSKLLTICRMTENTQFQLLENSGKAYPKSV